MEDGVVSEVVYHDLSGLGHYVKLQHGWGRVDLRSHPRYSVAQGQTVRRGELIGHSDNTGYSSGPHLHFAIRIHPYERTDGWGGFSDPLPYMNPDVFTLPPYVLPWTARQWLLWQMRRCRSSRRCTAWRGHGARSSGCRSA